MIKIESLRQAVEWVKAEITAQRAMIPMPFELDDLQGLTDQNLADMASQAPIWEFAKPECVLFPKHVAGEYREAHYIPAVDRVLLTAALIDNYHTIYEHIEPFNGRVNYDRPLTAVAEPIFFTRDYHDAYRQFKEKIWQAEKNGKWIIHTDIRGFAAHCKPDYVLQSLADAGCGENCRRLFDAAMKAWRGTSSCTGIPQGYAITDILLKLYLAQTDAVMTNIGGVSYSRYVDDIVLAADTRGEVEAALAILKETLSSGGLVVKDRETFISAPNDRGYGHAYCPETELSRLTDIITQSSAMYNRGRDYAPTRQDVLKVAYRLYIDPRSEKREIKPKYLFSHILREMKKMSMTDFADDLLPLLAAYPDRVTKLLKAAAETGCKDGALPLNGLSTYFFRSCELNDRTKDGMRLEYLSVLHDNDYPVAQYDLMNISGALQVIGQDRPVFADYAAKFDILAARKMQENNKKNTTGRHFNPL